MILLFPLDQFHIQLSSLNLNQGFFILSQWLIIILCTANSNSESLSAGHWDQHTFRKDQKHIASLPSKWHHFPGAGKNYYTSLQEQEGSHQTYIIAFATSIQLPVQPTSCSIYPSYTTTIPPLPYLHLPFPTLGSSWATIRMSVSSLSSNIFPLGAWKASLLLRATQLTNWPLLQEPSHIM